MVNLWPGRWVKFDGQLDGAHHARDGRTVGIFALTESVKKNGLEVGRRPYIAIVDKNGENLTTIIDGKLCEAKIFLDNQAIPQGLVGITDRQDIPAARLLNVPDDWQPRK